MDGDAHVSASTSAAAARPPPAQASSASAMTTGAPAPREVALFYKYVRVEDREAAADEQTGLCTRLGLAGRIRLAHEGVNGLVSGTPRALASQTLHAV